MPSAECGRCEVSLHQAKLIETCDEKDCPFKSQPKPDPNTTKPLSEMSFREMRAVYSEDDA